MTNNTLTVLKCALCSLLAASFLLAIIPSTDVHADICQDFTGNEDATDEDDFDDEYNQNVWKVWSVMRSYGLDENQAFAILANFCGEGSVQSWTTEGNYHSGMQEHCGVSEPGPEMAQYFQDNPTDYTDYFLTHYYDVDPIDITALHSGQSVDTSRYDTNVNAYYVDGRGACGIGLAGWTGGNCIALLDFAEANNTDWYTMETQLCFMLADSSMGGDDYLGGLMQRYKTETAGKSYQQCVIWFVDNYEKPAHPTTAKINRTMYAGQFSAKLHGKGWDQSYGADVVSGAGLEPAYRRSSILDVSMVHDWSAVGIYYPWNSGMLTSLTDDIPARNEEVYLGYINALNGDTDTSTTYSLFELYGEDVHWYRYLGESTVAPTLVDHIYSAWSQDRLDELGIEDTLNYSGTDYLSTQVYIGRPATLSTTDLKNGYIDPRVSLEGIGRFAGYVYVQGSFCMMIAKYIQSLISMLLGKELLQTAADILTEVETSDLFQDLLPAIWVLLGFAVIALIFGLVKKGVQYAKGVGAVSPNAIVLRFCISFMCIGFILCSTMNPAVFNDTIVSLLGCVDNVFNAALADGLQEDEVIAVTDPDLATRAAIWKTCIFEPWCRGQFGGLEYEQLYTQFASTADGQSAMPQSNQTVADVADSINVPYYNSAQLTGDIYVPVGGGKKIRNWAAYLYSCGTPYHIDSTLNGTDDLANMDLSVVTFPNANTTAHNSKLYADTFRIVDAQMNISPQFYKSGEIVYNYTDSNELDNNFGIEGIVMLVNAGLLLFLVPAIYEKIKNFVILLIITLQCIYYSFLELFKEDAGIPDFTRNLKRSLAGYFIADLKIYIMTLLYITFVDKGFVMSLIYCLLCFTVLSISLNDVTSTVKSIGNKAMAAIKRSNANRDLKKAAPKAPKS